jgi:hypothetical protein
MQFSSNVRSLSRQHGRVRSYGVVAPDGHPLGYIADLWPSGAPGSLFPVLLSCGSILADLGFAVKTPVSQFLL